MDPVSFAPVIHRLVRSAFVWLGSILLASFLLIGLPGEAHALVCTRQIEQDFDLRGWDEPSRWNCGLVPRPGDTAILPRIASPFQLPPNLALNRDVSIARFEMYSGRLANNYTMTVTQEMIWGGGNLHYINVAPFVSPAKTVIAPGAALKVRIDALDISSSGTFENFGDIHWQTAPLTLTTPRITGNKVINRGRFTVETGGEEWSTVAVCAPECTGRFAANTSGLPIHYNDDYIVIGANIPLPADPKLHLPTVQSSQ